MKFSNAIIHVKASELSREYKHLALSTELIRWIGHRKEIKSWPFERKPFFRANQGIVGCTWFIWKVVELRYW